MASDSPAPPLDRSPAVPRAAGGPGFRVEEIHYPPDYAQPPHAHDTTGITLVLAGALRETAAGREEEATSLSVVVKPAGTVHADRVGPKGARTIRVEVLDDAALLEDPREIGAWRWLHAGPGVRPLLRLRRMLSDFADPAVTHEAVVELVGEVVDADEPRDSEAPAWIRRAREALDDLAPRGVRVLDLAHELDVHPVSLTRAFRRVYGVPVSVYRRRERLRRAAAGISGTDRPISRIAHAAGYADHAHLCREVRDATGLTPSALRLTTRAG